MNITTRFMALRRHYRHRPCKVLALSPNRNLYTVRTIPLVRFRPGVAA